MIPGYTKEQALSEIERIATDTLPPGYVLDYTGESREIRREGNTMVGVLGASLVMVFLVLALQFDSFRDPLIILIRLGTLGAICGDGDYFYRLHHH